MPSTPLNILLEAGRQAPDRAGSTPAEQRTTNQQAMRQLEALHRYRQEYGRKLHDVLCQGMDAIALDNYRRFIHSLENAIGTAGQNLEQRTQKVAVSQQHWQHQQKRLSSY